MTIGCLRAMNNLSVSSVTCLLLLSAPKHRHLDHTLARSADIMNVHLRTQAKREVATESAISVRVFVHSRGHRASLLAGLVRSVDVFVAYCSISEKEFQSGK